MSHMNVSHSLWLIMSDEPKKEKLLTVRAKEIEFLNTKFAETKSWVTKSGTYQNIITIIFRDFEEMAARLRSVHKNLIESCLKNVHRQIENYSPPEMDFWINRSYFNRVQSIVFWMLRHKRQSTLEKLPCDVIVLCNTFSLCESM